MVIERRLLEYFATVAEHGSIGKAAETLQVTQPTLSQQIRKLESQTGVKLFVRSSTGVSLTDAGCVLLPLALSTIDSAQEFDRAAAAIRSGTSPSLKVGLVQNIPTAALSGLFGVMGRRVVGLRLETVVHTTPDNLTAVRTGQLDAAIVRGPVDSDSVLQSSLLAASSLGVLLSSDHPLAREPTIKASALTGQPLLYFPRSWAPFAFDAHAVQLAEFGVDLHGAQQSHSLPQTVSTVSAGLGVALVSAEWFPDVAGTKWRALADIDLRTTYLGVTRTAKRLPALLRTFHQSVVEVKERRLNLKD